MAVINCIIIEDELPASILLELHIARFDFLDLKGKFTSVANAQNILKSLEAPTVMHFWILNTLFLAITDNESRRATSLSVKAIPIVRPG